MQKVDVTSFIFTHRKHAGESRNNRTQSRSNGKGLHNVIVDLVCSPTKQIFRKRGEKCDKGEKDTRKQTVTISMSILASECTQLHFFMAIC